MPSLKYSTRIRTERLRVTIVHNLSTPNIDSFNQLSKSKPAPSRTHSMQRPKDIDILPYSTQLSFLISGSVDGQIASADQMCSSGVGRHLLSCMRRNADFLGVHNISEVHVENNVASISCTSSHPLPESHTSSNLTLVSLKLAYAWITPPDSFDDVGHMKPNSRKVVDNPILSPHIAPFRSLLDQVANRLFSHHILQHYPLIFGPYAFSIRAEQALFPIVAKSLCSIITRSKDEQLKQQALVSVEHIQSQNRSRTRATRRAMMALHPFLSTVESGSYVGLKDEDAGKLEKDFPFKEFADILGRGLTSMFQRRVKPWSKGLNIKTCDGTDEDIKNPSTMSNAVESIPNTPTCEIFEVTENSPEDLWVEDHLDFSDFAWLPQEDRFWTDMEVPSDLDDVEGMQLDWIPENHEGTLDLDSEDELMGILVDESHDNAKIHTGFLSHEPLLHKLPADSLRPLLSDPDHKLYALSDEHDITLLDAQGPQESLSICKRRDQNSDKFVSAIDLPLDLDDADSDMEVFEFGSSETA